MVLRKYATSIGAIEQRKACAHLSSAAEVVTIELIKLLLDLFKKGFIHCVNLAVDSEAEVQLEAVLAVDFLVYLMNSVRTAIAGRANATCK